MKKRKPPVLAVLAGLFFLAGAAVLLYPVLGNLRFEKQSQKVIEEFQKSVAQGQEEEPVSQPAHREESPSEEEVPTASLTAAPVQEEPHLQLPDVGTDLLRQMKDYNKKIYEEEQKGLCDAWSYQQNVFDFQAEGLRDDMIGYLTIDAMNIRLPLYIGANEANMLNGAAVLSQTSMPVGGKNTNCVIAAHRGYGPEAMFRDIEVLKPGDLVEVTNLWGTLYYEVIKTIAIYPDDIDAVKILEGEDLVTLITCHPYTQNWQRYVVYCARTKPPIQEEKQEQQLPQTTEEDTQLLETSSPEQVVIPYDGVEYESSQKAIQQERTLNIIGIVGIGILFLLFVILMLLSARRKKKYAGNEDS